MTESQSHTFRASDGIEVHYRYWATQSEPRGIVQIVHGAAEHGGRYDRFANALVSEGFAVYATDHRGHGRTRVRSGQLGDAGPDAWNRFVQDEEQLSRIIRERHTDVKLILFGHSLGSFIAQDYMTRTPALLDSVVLSGTSYGPPPPGELMGLIDAQAKKAPLDPSAFWAARFESFNKFFSNGPGFDWLSRDATEVKKYLDDPLSGFAFSNELVRDILQGTADLRDPAREANIPKDIPILIVQGELDPVGDNLKGTGVLLERYKELGLHHVSHHFYEGARHELLNEINRNEVTQDILNWLKAVM